MRFGQSPVSRTSIRQICATSIGAGLGIAVMIALARLADLPIAAVPFVTSIVLVMAAADTRFAQPRNLIGGHLACAAAGFVVLWTCGADPWLAAVAVGFAVAAMQLTDTMHPPAGINAVLIVVNNPSWKFFFVPVVAGAAILAAFAYAYHRVTAPGTWPSKME